jgi:hypothetical protein
MASKEAQPEPRPVKHPAFVPAEVPEHANVRAYTRRLITETLRQAWELTPWNQAVVIIVHKYEATEMMDAVALIAGPQLSLRVWVKSGHKLAGGKRVWIDPRKGKTFKGIPPWGAAPETPPDDSPTTP